jgi:5'-3' exonuclease
MGIPRFLSRYISQIPNVYVNIGNLGDVAVIWYDFNSVIHESRNRAYGVAEYLSAKEAESLKTQAKENPAKAHALHMKLIRETLEYILETFQPKDMLFLSIDGTPNLNKANQQRKRRYLSSKSAREDEVLSPNVISPGTQFMFDLDKELKELLGVLKAKYDIPLILYSSHLVPGEGEAKIFDNIRSGNYNFIGKHISIGIDSDLIPLSLALGRDDIYMYQGRDRNGKWQNNVISVATVRDYLLVQTGFLDATGRQRFSFNGLNVTKDIVSLFAFLTNDFLPSFIGFNQQGLATDEVLAAYVRYMKTDTYTKDSQPKLNYLTDDNGINMINMTAYLTELAKSEVKMIRTQRVNTEYLPSKILTESTTVENENTDRPKVKVDMEKLKQLWWDQFDYVDIPEGYNFSIVNKEFKDFVCQKYYEGINWFYTYYIFGQTHINLNWLYPFSFTPLLSDLVNYTYISDDSWNKREASFTPLISLLAIMPPKNFNLLPNEIRPLVEKGNLCDLAPVDFDVIKDGTFVSSEGLKDKTRIPENSIPLISPIPPYRIIYEVSKLTLDINFLKKYQAKDQQEIMGSRAAERQLMREFSKMAISGGRGAPRGRGEGRGAQRVAEGRGRPRGALRGRGRGEREELPSPREEKEREIKSRGAPRGRGEGRGRPRGTKGRGLKE